MRCRRRGHHRDSRHGVDPVDRGGQAGPSPGASAPTPTVQLYMPDGQLKSHSLRVYVTHELREEHNPQLRLLGGPCCHGRDERRGCAPDANHRFVRTGVV